MSKRDLLFVIGSVFFLLTGCAENRRYETVEQICVAGVDKAEAVQTAEDVLGQMHFTIEKADAQRGLIRTRLLPGAQFFEFWRSDNVGAFNCAEANLHSIRRFVQLHISQENGKLCIDCNVKAQRLNLPEHEVSSSARAYALFSRSTLSLQKLELYPEQKKGMAWIDLDNDTRLATEILERIRKQLESKSNK
jgi:hypothetical protein